MIRPSDKGPGRARPPRTKQARSGGSSGGGGGKKGGFGCPFSVAVPAGVVLFFAYLLAFGVPR